MWQELQRCEEQSWFCCLEVAEGAARLRFVQFCYEIVHTKRLRVIVVRTEVNIAQMPG